MDREASSLVTTQNCQLVRQMMHHAAAVLPQDLYVSQSHSHRFSLFVLRDMAGHISLAVVVTQNCGGRRLPKRRSTRCREP